VFNTHDKAGLKYCSRDFQYRKKLVQKNKILCKKIQKISMKKYPPIFHIGLYCQDVCAPQLISVFLVSVATTCRHTDKIDKINLILINFLSEKIFYDIEICCKKSAPQTSKELVTMLVSGTTK